MSEFPRLKLMRLATRFDFMAATAEKPDREKEAAAAIREAVDAYDQLAERLLTERVEWSLQIADYRARLSAVDPEFK